MRKLVTTPVSSTTMSLVILATISAGVIGCSGGNTIGSVSGTVTMDGAPLPNATVTFMPNGKGGPSYGRTDASGVYTLKYTRERQGAAVGEHTVMISTESSGDADADPPVPASPETVPAKYNSATTLTRTVEPGSNTINFDLDSGGEIASVGGDQSADAKIE